MRKPHKAAAGIVSVMGRIMLCAVFLAAALGYTAPDAQNLAQAVAAKGTIAPAWVLVGTMALLVAGSLSVVVGYKARFGALALLVFLALTTWYFHRFTFWNVVSSQARHEHIFVLVTNLSVMGAMLFIIANGSGRMSLDGKR
jgi:putative oxidoreductase